MSEEGVPDPLPISLWPGYNADPPTDEAVSAFLGLDFLSWICAASVERVGERASSGRRLDSPAQERSYGAAVSALRDRLRFESAFPPQGNVREPPGAIAARVFGSFEPRLGSSLATWLRQSAGGCASAAPPTGDPMLASAVSMAMDVYPLVLLPPSTEAHTPILYASTVRNARLWGHPASEGFIAALDAEDEPLRGLFPPGPIDSMTASRPFWSSSGQGGTIQAVFILEQVLANAELVVRFQGRPEMDAYVAEVTREVGQLRALASGRTARVTAFVGLGSASAALGTEVTTPWGTLSAVPEYMRSIAPVPAMLALSGSTDARLSFAVKEDGSLGAPPQEFFAVHEALERDVDLLRLAVLLALDRDPPVALMPAWQLVIDPTRFAGFSWGMAQPLPSAARIEPDDIGGLSTWASKVERHFDASILLAVRRTLASVSGRWDAADALVDAVIALENLFGTGQGEIGFRLSTAVAWLLEEHAPQRAERQKSVNKLYNVRSQIVHGTAVKPEVLQAHRAQASGLAVEALRALFERRPELIAARDRRGIRLVLEGYPRPEED